MIFEDKCETLDTEELNKSDRIFTEEEFIESVLEKDIYSKDLIGSMIITHNEINGILATDDKFVDIKWIIADVNHDKDNHNNNNIGYNPSNYYDLINVGGTRQYIFSTTSSIWKYSDIRYYLNDTFYNTFSVPMKDHMIHNYYESNGEMLLDYITIPSMTELGLEHLKLCCEKEGIKYPLYDSVNMTNYWTRSRYINNSLGVWYVIDGNMYFGNCTGIKNIAPLIRVSNN